MSTTTPEQIQIRVVEALASFGPGSEPDHP